MNLFYAPHLVAENSMVRLDEEESRHCTRVLRLSEGDEMILTDGRGLKVLGSYMGTEGRFALVAVQKSEVIPAPSCRLCMAVAPTKNHDRFEWFIEKASELGIQQIVPLITARSERKTIQLARLQRLMVAALKQSQSFYLPDLSSELSFEAFLKLQSPGQKFIAWCGSDTEPLLMKALKPGLSANILIGPEGDFTPQEVELAVQFGYVPISLGKKRLRTETAAMAACHIFNLINET